MRGKKTNSLLKNRQSRSTLGQLRSNSSRDVFWPKDLKLKLNLTPDVRDLLDQSYTRGSRHKDLTKPLIASRVALLDKLATGVEIDFSMLESGPINYNRFGYAQVATCADDERQDLFDLFLWLHSRHGYGQKNKRTWNESRYLAHYKYSEIPEQGNKLAQDITRLHNQLLKQLGKPLTQVPTGRFTDSNDNTYLHLDYQDEIDIRNAVTVYGDAPENIKAAKQLVSSSGLFRLNLNDPQMPHCDVLRSYSKEPLAIYNWLIFGTPGWVNQKRVDTHQMRNYMQTLNKLIVLTPEKAQTWKDIKNKIQNRIV